MVGGALPSVRPPGQRLVADVASGMQKVGRRKAILKLRLDPQSGPLAGLSENRLIALKNPNPSKPLRIVRVRWEEK